MTPFYEERTQILCWTLWENGDTDGADGSLDAPCECVVAGGKMIISNFDSVSPGMKNTKHDTPHTISVIDVTPLQHNLQPVSDNKTT
jgi:hypothetical protein